MQFVLTQICDVRREYTINADSKEEAWNKWYNDRASWELDYEDEDCVNITMESYEDI